MATEIKSKYFITKEPALPAKCVGCYNDKLELIDTTFSIDYYGAVLICSDCAKEMVSLIGFIDPERERKALELSNELTQELEIEKKKVEALEDVVRAYGLWQFTLTDESDSDLSTIKDEESSNSSEGSGDSGPEETEPGLFK